MATLQDLRNTGVGVAERSQDTLYIVTKPDLSTGNGYVGDDNYYPFPENTETSKPLFPQYDQSWAPTGTYLWTFEFQMTVAEVLGARITGRFRADDEGQCFFNSSEESTVGGLGVWTSFDITSGFVAGSNKLEFNVYNDPVNGTVPAAKNTSTIEVQFTEITWGKGVANAIMFSCNT